MNELKELLKTIRFEKFTIRESASHLIFDSNEVTPVYINSDDKSELKDLTNNTAKDLADIAIFS